MLAAIPDYVEPPTALPDTYLNARTHTVMSS